MSLRATGLPVCTRTRSPNGELDRLAVFGLSEEGDCEDRRGAAIVGVDAGGEVGGDGNQLSSLISPVSVFPEGTLGVNDGGGGGNARLLFVVLAPLPPPPVDDAGTLPTLPKLLVCMRCCLSLTAGGAPFRATGGGAGAGFGFVPIVAMGLARETGFPAIGGGITCAALGFFCVPVIKEAVALNDSGGGGIGIIIF